MQTYGQTVKKIRRQKGFLIKEIYSGILGRTTAYRFEQGITNISTEKLVSILSALGIYSMDEFFYLHQRADGIQQHSLDKILTIIIRREGLNIKSNKRRTVWNFYVKYKNSNIREERFYAYVAHLDFLWNKKSEVFTLPELPAEFQDEYRFIENYLLSIENWTLRELDLFPFLSSCFHDDARPLLMERFKKSYLSYQDYHEDWEVLYAGNLLNYAMNSVFLKKYSDLLKNTAEIELLFSEYPQLHWHLIHKCRLIFLQALCAAHHRNSPDIQNTFQQLQNIAEILPENTELIDFYLVYTRKKVHELYPDFNLASKLRK